MVARTVVPFALADGPCLLEDIEGKPVWPIRRGQMMARLEKSCAALSIELRAVKDARPCAGGATGPDSVASLGSEAKAPARLHAWLTGRRFIGCVDHAGEVSATVYVALSSKVSRSLLSEIYRDTAIDGPAPGIVHDMDTEALWEQVLHRALTTLHSLDGDLASVLPLQPHSSPPTVDVIRETLTAAPGVLMIHSHADGLDAFLHPELTLCPLPSALHRPPGERPPFCVETGRCYRQQAEIGSAIWRDRVFDPVNMSGHVVVLAICSSLLEPSGTIGAEWGLVPAALRAPRTGAIVATWTVNHTAAADFDGFLECLIRGAPLGQAVARHNAGVTEGSGGYLCLFGDPAIRLTPRETAATNPSPGAALPPADLAGIAFLRPLLEMAALNNPQRAALEALEAARFYDVAARLGWPLEFEGGPGQTLRAALNDYLTQRGVLIFVDWSRISDAHGTADLVTCPHCGSRAFASTRRIRAAEAELRCLVVCDSCGIVEDRPQSLSIHFRVVSEGALEVSGMPEHGALTVAVRMGCQDDARSVALSWPRDAEGRLVPVFKPQEGWAPGSMRLTLMVMAGARLALYTVQTRAPARRLLPPT